MSETLLPDFDGPRDDPAPAVPKRPRRSTKKKAKRAAPAPKPKPAKRVPKKRRARKIGGRHPNLAMSFEAELGVTPGVDAIWSGKSSEALGALMQLPVAARKLVITVALALTK